MLKKKIGKNLGFTLIELLVVISIIGLLATASLVLLNNARIKSRDAKRVSGLKQIQTALELYYDANNGYPNSGGSWRSECPTWGGYAANNVIPGLVPAFMGVFPADPSMDKTNNRSCYIYLSDGKDYALLDYQGSEIVYTRQPSLIDPRRDSGADNCVVDGAGIWSWKVSSPGGRCW